MAEYGIVILSLAAWLLRHSIYHDDFTQHDLFGLFPGAPGGRARRDAYGHVYLITIATRGGQNTLKRYGREYMRELASRVERPSVTKKIPSRATLPAGAAPPSATFPIAQRAAGVAGHASSASFWARTCHRLANISRKTVSPYSGSCNSPICFYTTGRCYRCSIWWMSQPRRSQSRLTGSCSLFARLANLPWSCARCHAVRRFV
jgi:hypothetical protein